MKKTIKDYDLKGKKVIIRCDLNVPIKNGIIIDDTRIKESLETIKYALDKQAKVIILSHLGKIKKESDKQENSLYPVAVRLGELLNKEVIFANDCVGSRLENRVKELKEGDVLLVENTRYEDIPDKKESNCDVNLAKYWASLGDIFINDAYGTLHRCHTSNVGIAKYLPNGMGFLVEKEITKLGSILNEDTRPFIVIMGGKKVSDKIPIIKNLITKCDYLLIGGAMAYTFLKAQNKEVGKSIVDIENIDFCLEMLKQYSSKIILPIDNITLNGYKEIDSMQEDDIGYDIGDKTIMLFKQYIISAKRIIMNGPLGMYEDERYRNGTKEILKTISENKIKAVIGGGDTIAAINELGSDYQFYHVSTGGGATLAYLSGEDMPGLEVISDEEV